jgi:hypothetical protein
MAENFNIEQRNYFSNGGKINIEMLNNISNNTADSINNVNRLLYTPGVLFLPSNISKNFSIVGNSPTSGNGTSLTINVGFINSDETNAPFGGIAIDNLGRTIIISKNETYEENVTWKTDGNGWGSTPGDWRPDDPDLVGTDNAGPTGQYNRNSGNFNIPLEIDENLTSDEQNTNFIYIKYLQVVSVDSNTGQTMQKVSTDNITSYAAQTHYVSGYQIICVNPNMDTNAAKYGYSKETFDADLRAQGYIKLGEVYVKNNAGNYNFDGATSTGNATVPTPGTTQYGYFNGSMVGSSFKGLIGGATQVYPQTGDTIDFDTHINAIGNGTVSATNPHGLTPADIGLNISTTNAFAVDSITADQSISYTLNTPLRDLSTMDEVEQNYNTILIDANGNTSDITIRLPDAETHPTYKYTFKRMDSDASANVSISTYSDADPASAEYLNNNLINGIARVTGYSVLQLGVL